MKLTHLRPSDYRRMRWKNGLGWTAEIARSPDGDAEAPFDWRISIADIESDSDFSQFPGYERSIAVIEGNGMELSVDRAVPVVMRTHESPLAFSGDAPARCRLLDGPTRDFNVMSRRGAVSQRLMLRPLVGPMVLFREPGVTWLIHVVGGRVERQHIATSPFEAGDSVLIESDPGSERQVVLSGGGELLLARLERLS